MALPYSSFGCTNSDACGGTIPGPDASYDHRALRFPRTDQPAAPRACITRLEGTPLMLALLGVGFDLLGYAAVIVIEAINLASPGIRFG
ncbi:hypothetical protein A2J03_03945 [Rhodococcus sp. EPR-157]|nr:hypothetical protein A2J03_03945 [Rhodococcus sp. EPR-157]